ncbi:hypothetical protein, partial [Klebsiella variicola]|uniref:hypothetical protein n=1 Tax=Klebsiella variicola TaxID=244366 RepID=UPI002B06114C
VFTKIFTGSGTDMITDWSGDDTILILNRLLYTSLTFAITRCLLSDRVISDTVTGRSGTDMLVRNTFVFQ